MPSETFSYLPPLTDAEVRSQIAHLTREGLIPGIEFTGLSTNARTIFAAKGNIWLGQAKLTLGPPGSSMKIPLSMTVSSGTELIDKPTWRGQVGLAYDLDSLLGALK